MGDFIKKNGNVISFWTGLVSVVSIAGGYVISLIRDDKREIKRHKKLEEVYESQIDFYRSVTMNGKES